MYFKCGILFCFIYSSYLLQSVILKLSFLVPNVFHIYNYIIFIYLLTFIILDLPTFAVRSITIVSHCFKYVAVVEDRMSSDQRLCLQSY